MNHDIMTVIDGCPIKPAGPRIVNKENKQEYSGREND
jgi:hypothetical protein